MQYKTMSKYLFWILIVFSLVGCKHNGSKEKHPESALPSLYVTMQPEQLDSILINRDYLASAEALLLSDERDTIYCGELTHIKTRGNYSFKMKKKSFTIKFPYKMRLLGLNKDKSFVLLANACDESHIRDAIGLDLAKAMGIPASRYAYLKLYINNRYQGLYQITNKVKVGKQTLNITDLDELNEQVNPRPLHEYATFAHGMKDQYILRKGVLLERSPDDITGGYLLDNSSTNNIYNNDVSGFVSHAGDLVRIRSPKYASVEEVEYISDWYDQMEKAVHSSDGYNSQTGKHYSDYLDVESFAHYYLLNEVLMNLDGGWSSFMMYKDSDSLNPRIYAGPAWDFDRSLFNPFFERNLIVLPNELFVCCEKGLITEPLSGGLLYHLMKHEDFKEIVKSCYYKEISPICHDYLERGYWDSIVDYLHVDAESDSQVEMFSKDYDAAVSRAMDFFSSRLDFLDWYFSAEEKDMIKMTIPRPNSNNKKVYAYYPLGTEISTPQLEFPYNKAPFFTLYYEGTDDVVKEGTVFQTSQNLELRERNPKWREVQIRRIRKKLKK